MKETDQMLPGDDKKVKKDAGKQAAKTNFFAEIYPTIITSGKY